MGFNPHERSGLSGADVLGDSTLNFWEGCTKVSAGCQHCYAEARDKRFTGGKLWGEGAHRRKSKSAVKQALAFNRKPWICDFCGASNALANANDFCECGALKEEHHRRRIFSLSLGDWLDDEVPIEWLAEMLDTIRQCDQVTWILCTKRPELFQKQMRSVGAYLQNQGEGKGETSGWIADWSVGHAPQNIILLASVENQAMAAERILELLKIPAACRGLSMEPLLGPVDCGKHLGQVDFECYSAFNSSATFSGGVKWLIIGGESGPNARPCNVDWIRSLVTQGKAAGVATFVKQLGSRPITDEATPDGWPAGTNLIPRTGETARVALHDKKGGDPAEWPADLRVQEWPTLP